MNRQTINFIQLGLSILVLSSSGALGKYISLPVPLIIWVRCAIGTVAIFLFLVVTRSIRRIPAGRETRSIVISSIFMGLHWLTYFWSLKLSNVSIGMLSLFTYPVITAILEPIMTRTRFKWSDILLALMAFTGVFFLVPELKLSNDVTLGVVMGLISAVVYSVRNILLKQSVTHTSGTLLMFYQLLLVTVFLVPFLFYFPVEPNLEIANHQWFPIVLLALYTTALGHTLLVRSFKHFQITTISIITCLTPVLGILQAYLFLNEKPTHQVLIGGSIIMFSVVIESIRSIRNS